MLINKTSLSEIFLNLKTTFNKWYATTETTWEKIAMRVPSTSSENSYKWLSRFPRMRRWVGEKNVKALKGFSYTVVNDDWEATVELDRNDIEDDNVGVVVPETQMAGESAKRLPDEIVYELVNQGFEKRCFDGQYFFDTDHPVGESTVSNKGTMPLSASTKSAAQASLGFARAKMRGFKDEDGRPLGVRGTTLLVPGALEDEANTLKNAERLEDGKVNPYRGTFEVVVGDYLESDTAWFLLDTSKPIKPFIYQERKKPFFVQMTDMNAENVFMRKQYLYGAEARAAGGYGFWQLAFGSTGTGS